MLYSKKYRQVTVAADTPEEFDRRINEVFARADGSGQLPEIHYFDGVGLCASVRYWVSQEIPETARERHELTGDCHLCPECRYYEPITDGRVRRMRCEASGKLRGPNEPACDLHYEELDEERRTNGVFESYGRNAASGHLVREAG